MDRATRPDRDTSRLIETIPADVSMTGRFRTPGGWRTSANATAGPARPRTGRGTP